MDGIERTTSTYARALEMVVDYPKRKHTANIYYIQRLGAEFRFELVIDGSFSVIQLGVNVGFRGDRIA